jgi:Lectin C-type domain
LRSENDKIYCTGLHVGFNGGDLLDTYWTSGSDEFHEGLFKWCSTPKAENVSAELKFKTGEPNNGGGAENCMQCSVLADPMPNNLVLSDHDCNNTQRYICEAIIIHLKEIQLFKKKLIT